MGQGPCPYIKVFFKGVGGLPFSPGYRWTWGQSWHDSEMAATPGPLNNPQVFPAQAASAGSIRDQPEVHRGGDGTGEAQT